MARKAILYLYGYAKGVEKGCKKGDPQRIFWKFFGISWSINYRIASKRLNKIVKFELRRPSRAEGGRYIGCQTLNVTVEHRVPFIS